MEILFIACAPPYPLHSEHQKLLAHLIHEFARRRAVIDLLAFYDEPEDLIDAPRYEPELRYLQLIKAPTRDLQTRLQQGTIVPADKNGAWSPEMWHAVQTRIHDANYDFVHLIGGIEVYEYASLVHHKPHLIQPLYSQTRIIQQSLSHATGRTQRRNLTQQIALFQQYEAQMYQQFNTVVLANEIEEKTLRRLANYDNLISLPPGIETDYFIPTGQEPAQPAILFIRDFQNDVDTKAALKLCTEIFPAVRRAVPETHLYILGDAPPSELQAQASEQIDIVGAVLDRRPFFDLATVYVNPIAAYTGIRDDLLQALAMATPAVVTPDSCIGLELEPDRHVLIAETAHEMSMSIVRLLQSAELRQRLRRQARERVVDYYDWQAIAAEYEAIYQRYTSNRTI